MGRIEEKRETLERPTWTDTKQTGRVKRRYGVKAREGAMWMEMNGSARGEY